MKFNNFLIFPLIFNLLMMTMFLALDLQSLQAAESSTYDFQWLDPEKEVYVLQNRKFRKKSKLYANIGTGVTTSGPFTSGYNFQGKFGFFFMEEWGFEFVYSHNTVSENENAASVKSAGSIPFHRDVEGYMGAMVVWAPFYSKINTFNKIFYYDWLFGLGISQLSESNNKKQLDLGTTQVAFDDESFTSLMMNIGLKFYFTEKLSSRIDLTGLYYSAPRGIKGQSNSNNIFYKHYDLTFSVGYTF